jgi:NTP pyrophosphatase (non-canonical NTP hydrolase)
MERSSLPLLHGKTERLAERRTEVSKKVSDILPKTEILAQLAEEASELAQAALKLRRALDGTNPTPKSVAECEANLLEEFADISNAVNALCNAWFGDDLDSECEFWDAEFEIKDAKYKRWLSRLEAKEQNNG